jgi:hypothetical protein
VRALESGPRGPHDTFLTRSVIARPLDQGGEAVRERDEILSGEVYPGMDHGDVRSTRVGNGKASGEPLPDGPEPGITLTVPAATGAVVRIRTGR